MSQARTVKRTPTDVWPLHVPHTSQPTRIATEAARASRGLLAVPLRQVSPCGFARHDPIHPAICCRSRRMDRRRRESHTRSRFRIGPGLSTVRCSAHADHHDIPKLVPHRRAEQENAGLPSEKGSIVTLKTLTKTVGAGQSYPTAASDRREWACDNARECARREVREFVVTVDVPFS